MGSAGTRVRTLTSARLTQGSLWALEGDERDEAFLESGWVPLPPLVSEHPALPLPDGSCTALPNPRCMRQRPDSCMEAAFMGDGPDRTLADPVQSWGE